MKQSDMVLSYTVGSDGATHGDEALQKALQDGYRVVDILQAVLPVAYNGNASKHGTLAVTVFLTTKDGPSTYYRPRG